MFLYFYAIYINNLATQLLLYIYLERGTNPSNVLVVFKVLEKRIGVVVKTFLLIPFSVEIYFCLKFTINVCFDTFQFTITLVKVQVIILMLLLEYVVIFNLYLISDRLVNLFTFCVDGYLCQIQLMYYSIIAMKDRKCLVSVIYLLNAIYIYCYFYFSCV